jgi:predicted porin
MTRKALVMAVALACTAPAWAQFHAGNPNSAIEIGGQVDAAVVQTNNGGSVNNKKTGVDSGVGSASRWYLRGTEDLGGGLKAAFILDMGFDLDTGSLKNYQGYYNTATPAAPNGTAVQGFNRRSVVGMYGGYGSLWLGRDYMPVYWAGYDIDILNYNYFGNLQTVVALSGTTAERFARASNGVFYRTPRMGGFRAIAAYSLGSEAPGGTTGALPKDANHMWGLGFDFRPTMLNGLVLNGSYQELKYPLAASGAFTGSLEKRTDWMLGGGYDFKVAKVSGGYWSVKKPPTSASALGPDGSAEFFGASVPFGAFKASAQWHRVSQDNPTGETKHANIYALVGGYSFSQRTAAYVTWGKTNNNSTAAFPLVSAENSVAPAAIGNSPSAFGIGMKMDF